MIDLIKGWLRDAPTKKTHKHVPSDALKMSQRRLKDAPKTP